jgi:hypothetical protein
LQSSKTPGGGAIWLTTGLPLSKMHGVEAANGRSVVAWPGLASVRVNRPLATITGPEFMNAIARCGWKEGIGTHFFREFRKDGPTLGITTRGQLPHQSRVRPGRL